LPVGVVCAFLAVTIAAPSTAASRVHSSARTKKTVQLPNGRRVTPTGRQIDVGVFPSGIAVSPNSRIAVVANTGTGTGLNPGMDSFCNDVGKPNQCNLYPASQIGDPATPAPDQGLSVINLRSRQVSFVTAVPTVRDPLQLQYNFFGGGVAFSPDGSHLYATGGANDAVYDFSVQGSSLLTPPRTLSVSTTGTSLLTARPPGAFTRGIAVTPDGSRLLVTTELGDEVVIVDAASLTVQQRVPLSDVPTKCYPSNVVVTKAEDRVYVTCQGTSSLSVLALGPQGAFVEASALVGDHPTALALTGDGRQLLVANANDDTLVVVDTRRLRVERRLRLRTLDKQLWGASPNAVTITPDSKRAYVALGGDNAVAVLNREGRRWSVAGELPTGWYPAAIGYDSARERLLAVAAKGRGSRYVRGGPYPSVRGSAVPNSYYSVANNMPGLVSVIPAPSSDDLEEATERVRANMRVAASRVRRPARNPIPPPKGGRSPITHVVYIVRQNRTFDQVFGDLGQSRRDVDADPNYASLAAATPNGHRLATRYGTSDRFFSNGEVSAQAHWWTAGANITDYLERSWPHYYSGRTRPRDDSQPIATPRSCTLFQTALEKQTKTGGAFTFRNYGEFNGTIGPNPNCAAIPPQNLDLSFDSSFEIDNRTSARNFLSSVGLDTQGQQVGDPAQTFLPNFTYVTLAGDHTQSVRGTFTPRADVARNDAGLGMIVSALSRSRYWPNTAVVVVEDDSQDGPDHVDGHRNVLLVISPYARNKGAKGVPGYVGHTHRDQADVVRTIELILGLPAMSAYDQNAAPLYEFFQNKDRAAKLTPSDIAPYDVEADPPFVNERVADVLAAPPPPA
jgi:DNA-binding beta-propeller fold protein YncE